MTDPNTPPAADETPAALVEPSPAPKQSKKRLYVILGAVAVLILAGAGGGIFVAVSSANAAAEKRANEIAALEATREKALDAFDDALNSCGIADVDDWAVVSDGGETMELNGAGKYVFSGLPFQKTECVLRILDAPTRVATLMGQTRALDGRQNDSWDADYGTIDVSWSYHPDAGLDALLSLELSDELQDIPTE